MTVEDDNQSSRQAWNANARFWDERMGEGNEFFRRLVWPAVERLLGPVAGERWLDLACGNGLTSRQLAEAGATVIAVDFSEELLACARQQSGSNPVEFRLLDLTDRQALRALGGDFDGALCGGASFPAGGPRSQTVLSWSGRFSEIPPVLVARMRVAG